MSRLKNVRQRWGDSLAESRWDDFERLLADYYRGQGFDVEHVGTGASRAQFDGGIDLKLRKDGNYTVVQCKRWTAKQVPHNDVHQLLGVMATEGAQSAILVTSGEFTAYAREAAGKVGCIELVDGVVLRQRLGPLLPTRPILPGESRAEEYLDLVVEAVADRIAGGGRRRSRAVEVGLGVIAAKAIAFLLLVGFLLLVVPRLFTNLLTSTLPTPATQVATPPAQTLPTPGPVPAEGVLSMSVQEAATRNALAPYQPQPNRNAGRPEPIAQIGSADEMMSPEELAEWKRKNAESMKVLEDRVPELRR